MEEAEDRITLHVFDKIFYQEFINMDPKCTVCKKTKPVTDFLKNGKTLKSCLGCREKRTKQNVMSPVVVKSDELHKECMQKMNEEFREKAAFPVHQYLMRWVFVDIRDGYCPSGE